jgi:hypothetical protein
MPTFVMKVARDRDLYVGWSTVVENLVWAGTRAEALAVLARDIPVGYEPKPGNSPEDRLQRADETGTSACWYDTDPQDGAWDDPVQIVEQRGLLRRADLARYVDLYTAGDAEGAFALLKVFEDEAADHG